MAPSNGGTIARCHSWSYPPLCASCMASILLPPGHSNSLFSREPAPLKSSRPLGTRPGLTVHGLRSSFRDWAGDRTAYPRDVIEMALAHSIKDKSEAAYRRGDANKLHRVPLSDRAMGLLQSLPRDGSSFVFAGSRVGHSLSADSPATWWRCMGKSVTDFFDESQRSALHTVRTDLGGDEAYIAWLREAACRLVTELENEFHAGNKVSVLKCIHSCVVWGLPVPLWAKKYFVASCADGYQGKLESWDDAFGRPITQVKHLQELRHGLRWEVYDAVRAASAAGVPIDNELFERIGRELGIGGRNYTQRPGTLWQRKTTPPTPRNPKNKRCYSLPPS